MTGVKTNKLVTTSCLPTSLYEIMRRISRQHMATIELSFEYVGCVTEKFSNNESMKTCKSSSPICERLVSVLFSQRRDLDVLGVVFVLFSILFMEAFNVISFSNLFNLNTNFRQPQTKK